MKRARKNHIITLVNNPDFSNPEHTLTASVREARAIRQARKLEKAGKKNIMLFRVDKLGNRHRVSLRDKTPEWKNIRVTGHNTAWAGEPIGDTDHKQKQVASKLKRRVSESERMDEMVDFYRATQLMKQARTA